MIWTSLIVLLAPWLASTLLLTDVVMVRAADEQCVEACSEWSVVLGHCTGLYHDSTKQRDYDYANNYVACICRGDTDNDPKGNESISSAAGICLSCSTTPKIVKKNLQDFLSLCVVQARNGTAENATLYSPVGYSTSQDTSKNGQGSGTSGAGRAGGVGLGMGGAWAAATGVGAVVLGLVVLG
ncbi:hypothetical protein IAT38_002066 [Cryptococcus sp. DSM 104549]